MKNFFAFLVLSLFLTYSCFAQSPQLVNYQAVARDLSGNPLITTPVNITFDVLQGSSTGSVVYSETHVSSTNQFGLFTAEIGGGTPVAGTFGGILWGSGLYYLRVTVNGDIMPATQLLSVPYALHAKTATSGVPGANGHANLADSIAEAPGVNCANGGYLIYMGADDNDDNILQPLERDIQYYICNGLDGAANNNDTSATNELQTLSISNDTIFLTNGGFVILPASSGSLWNTNGQGIDYVAGNVGVGISTPIHKLTVNSSDTIIASFRGTNPNVGAIAITNSNSNAAVGAIFLSGTDTAILALDPNQKLLGINNTTSGGHLALNADSSVSSNAKIISNVAQEFILNNSDTIFNISQGGNIINVNQGTFVTDSLYVVGNNKDSTNWLLANDGFGQAKWTNPSALGLGGGLWQSSSPDIFFNTGNVGVGTSPLQKFHVSGGNAGVTTVALFERAGFFGATIDINSTGSNGAGIKFQNGGVTTSSITSSTTNVLSLISQVVEVGNSPKTGFFNVAGSSTITSPTIQLHEATSGFSRIKHTNNVPNKYWIVEAGINTSNPMSGYSIGYNNGVSTSLPFIVYGDNKVGINNIASPLASFHVMDINTTGNGIVSEGFNQAGLLVVARNNFTSPNRGAILNGDEIGRIIFPGYHAGGFGDGPKIFAKATENYLSTANGSELVFRTIANGTVTSQDALKLLNDGRAEIPVGLLIPTGAANNFVLTSDPSGNASWQPAAGGSPWTKTGTSIYQNVLTDYVGIGTNSPDVALNIFGSNTATTLSAFNPTPETTIRIYNSNQTNNNFSALSFTTQLSNNASSEMGKLVVQNVNHTIGSQQGDMVFMTRNSANLFERMRITGNGDVGIGTNIPTARLDVDNGGSIEVDGEYTYESSKLRTLHIPINALNFKRNPASSSAANLIFYSYVGGYYGESAYCYFTGGVPSTDAVATAPIYLPQGANLVSLKVKWFDMNSTFDASLSIESVDFNTINNSQMGIVTTTGSSTSTSGMQTTTTSTFTSPIIDNDNKAYYVKFQSKEATQNVGFAKIVITYSVDKAD